MLNRTLKDEITKLKQLHIQELTSLIATNQAKIVLVAEKINWMVEKINSDKIKRRSNATFFLW